MSGETQGFRVKPGELLAVAEKVRLLLEDISGGSGGTGHQSDFTTNANTSHLQGALATLFPSIGAGDPYVEAYGLEYDGLSSKYQAIVDYLTELEQACRTTAIQYGASEDDSSTAINKTEVGPGPGAPSPTTPVPL